MAAHTGLWRLCGVADAGFFLFRRCAFIFDSRADRRWQNDRVGRDLFCFIRQRQRRFARGAPFAQRLCIASRGYRGGASFCCGRAYFARAAAAGAAASEIAGRRLSSDSGGSDFIRRGAGRGETSGLSLAGCYAPCGGDLGLSSGSVPASGAAAAGAVSAIVGGWL